MKLIIFCVTAILTFSAGMLVVHADTKTFSGTPINTDFRVRTVVLQDSNVQSGQQTIHNVPVADLKAMQRIKDENRHEWLKSNQTKIAIDTTPNHAFKSYQIEPVSESHKHDVLTFLSVTIVWLVMATGVFWYIIRHSETL